MRTQPPDTRHPGSNRAFRDFHVPKLLSIEQNIKKISYSCARQLREYFMILKALGIFHIFKIADFKMNSNIQNF